MPVVLNKDEIFLYMFLFELISVVDYHVSSSNAVVSDALLPGDSLTHLLCVVVPSLWYILLSPPEFNKQLEILRIWFDERKLQLQKDLVDRVSIIVHLITTVCNYEEGCSDLTLKDLLLIVLPVANDVMEIEWNRLLQLYSSTQAMIDAMKKRRDELLANITKQFPAASKKRGPELESCNYRVIRCDPYMYFKKDTGI